MTDADNTTVDDQQQLKEFGDKVYILKWSGLIILGCLAEFFGRYIWYSIDSFKIIPATLGILAALLILYGYANIVRSKEKADTMKRRNGAMLVVMGICMMACFGIFRPLMPLLFG